MSRFAFSLLASIGLLTGTMTAPWTATALAEESPGTKSDDAAPTTRLVLHPAGEPTPALKYQLLPTLLDRKPGNAAVIYNKMGQFFGEQSSDETLNKLFEWLEMPSAEMPRDEARSSLSAYGYQLRQIRRASRMQHCDWQLPLGEEDSFSIHLPELQTMRNAARLLALQARLEIADGNLDAALATIQSGYALAKHTGEGPTLVNHLVGIAISDLMTQRLMELIQQPGAPNLYWAVTCLGDDWIDARPGMELERFSLDLTYSWWRELDAKDQSTVWRTRFDEFMQGVGQWSGQSEEWQTRLGVTAAGIKGYPRAKKFLIDQGRNAADVEAMPVAQVLMIYTIETYRELHDDVYKWLYLPYWQVHEQIEIATRQIEEDSAQREIVPLARLLVPAVTGFSQALARHQRSLAMLRVVEAVRLHGAAHDGKLPEKLTDITEVPLPTDPLTGKAFVYHVADGIAVLQSRPPADVGHWNRDLRLRYEIRFAP